MSDAVIEALSAARDAHVAATGALLRAEEAARAVGVESRAAPLDELTVKRINVVEDDGTLRIVIGNSSFSKRLPLRGRLVEHPGRSGAAGLLFVNDEGTECGGLIFAGKRDDHGKTQAGYLAFDEYEQNEGFRFGMSQDADGSRKYLEFSDQPAWSLVDLIEETEGLDDEASRAVHDRYFGEVDGRGRSRMRLAREDDGSVRLVLRDGEGRDRLRLVVPADGEAVVEVLDAKGTARAL